MEHGDRFEDGEDLLEGDGESLWKGGGGERHNGLAAHN